MAWADAAVNNLAALRYALDAGMPAIEWEPATKNAAEAERVLRAERQFGDQARAALLVVAGRITIGQFYDAIGAIYERQARNSYVAGRRAVGDLRPLTDEDAYELEGLVDEDVRRLGDLPTELAAGGFGALLLAMVFDPTNYLGSGLPGDPFAGLPPPLGAGKKADSLKAAQKVVNRLDSYGSSVRQYSHAGELDAIGRASGPRRSLWWVLGAADHCIDCIRLSDGSPYYSDALSGSGCIQARGTRAAAASATATWSTTSPRRCAPIRSWVQGWPTSASASRGCSCHAPTATA